MICKHNLSGGRRDLCALHRNRDLGTSRQYQRILRRRRRRAPVMNGMATAADWMSAASFISMAGLISTWVTAAPVSRDGRVATFCWPCLGAPTCASSGSSRCLSSSATASTPRVRQRVAVLCPLTASITYIIGQMTGVGVAFPASLGVSNEVGIYVVWASCSCMPFSAA